MNKSRIILLIILSAVFWESALPGQALSWELLNSSEQFVLQLTPVAAAENTAATDLRVFVGERKEWPGEESTAVLGQVAQSGAGWQFRPTFPFRTGVRYTAFWRQGIPFHFSIPQNGGITALSAIYPSAETVPANLLKIYLHFSAPMGEGRAYEHLLLVSAAGDTVHQPFVPLQPELWSEDRRRLTLWLDPGRVKRGLLSHETQGVVIAQDQEYRLQIHPDWKDANGQRLGKRYEKIFRVIAPDYASPAPNQWKLQIPPAGSNEPLVIDFREPLDQALASRLIQIRQRPEVSLAGMVQLKANETQWYFYPKEPWTAGSYQIQINNSLEDLAGNNLNRPFDREIIEHDPEIIVQDGTILEFVIESSE